MRDGAAVDAARELVAQLDHVLTLARGALGSAEPERAVEYLTAGLAAAAPKIRELHRLSPPTR